MNIDNRILELVEWASELTTDDVHRVVGGNHKAVYMALRRLMHEGLLTKTIRRGIKTPIRKAYWTLEWEKRNGKQQQTT